MNQNLEKPVTDFSFFIAPDKNLVMRCPTGFAPVAAFTTVLRVDDSVVHASFALDDNGNLQHSNFPFETLSVSIRHQRVYINGLPGSPIGRDDGMDTRSVRTQGIITALIPSPPRKWESISFSVYWSKAWKENANILLQWQQS